jgi:hypothetical protein
MPRYRMKKGAKFWANNGVKNMFFEENEENRKFVEENPEWKLGRLNAFPASTYTMTMAEKKARKKEKLRVALWTGKYGRIKMPEQLFLVTGVVQKNTVGVGQVQAEQTRLVWARYYEHALTKFREHFEEMNTDFEQYTVISSSISHAIK